MREELGLYGKISPPSPSHACGAGPALSQWERDLKSHHHLPGLAVKPAARYSAAPTCKTVASSSALTMT